MTKKSSAKFIKDDVPLSFPSMFLGSGISAIITKTSVAPLERIKILKQSQCYYTQQHYSSIYKSFKFIWKNEGLRGFYRGNYSNITRIIPSYMIKFPLNESYKQIFGITKDEPGKLFISGTFAGLTQVCLTYPLDIMRTRMSLDHYMTTNYNKYTTCGYNIFKTEGLRGFYKGFSSSLITYPIYVGLQFSIYTHLKDENPYVAGATAGIIAQTLAFPGDTIKRQLQLNGLDNTKSKFTGLLSCIKSIYRQYGIKGYYAGLGVNVLKAAPEAAIQFAVYEAIKKRVSDMF